MYMLLNELIYNEFKVTMSSFTNDLDMTSMFYVKANDLNSTRKL